MIKYYLYENTKRKGKDSFELKGSFNDKEAAFKEANLLKDIFIQEKEDEYYFNHRKITLIISTKADISDFSYFTNADGSFKASQDLVWKFKIYV